MATENYRILDERDLNELEKEDKSLKESILKNEKNINDIKEDVDELQGNVSNMSESIGEIKTDITDIEDNIANVEGKVDTIEGRIDNINDEVDIVVSVGDVDAYSAENDDPDVKISPSEDGTKGKLDFEFYIPKGAIGLTGEKGDSIKSLNYEISSDGLKNSGRVGQTDYYSITFEKANGDTYTVPDSSNGIKDEEAFMEQCFKIVNGSEGSNGINGKSAYEIAGGDDEWGSEEAWLESLKATPLPLSGVTYDFTEIKGNDGAELTADSANCLFFEITDTMIDEIKAYELFSATLTITKPIAASSSATLTIPPTSFSIDDFFTYSKDNTGKKIGIDSLNSDFSQFFSVYAIDPETNKMSGYYAGITTTESGILIDFPQALYFNLGVDSDGGTWDYGPTIEGNQPVVINGLEYSEFLGGNRPVGLYDFSTCIKIKCTFIPL